MELHKHVALWQEIMQSFKKTCSSPSQMSCCLVIKARKKVRKFVKDLKLKPLLLTDDTEDGFQSSDLVGWDLQMKSWKCFLLKICCTHPGYKTPRFLLLNKTDNIIMNNRYICLKKSVTICLLKYYQNVCSWRHFQHGDKTHLQGWSGSPCGLCAQNTESHLWTADRFLHIGVTQRA